MKSNNYLDRIKGIDLKQNQKSLLRGGYEYGMLWCVSCKDSGWEHLGNIEYEGEADNDQMRTACQAEYPLTQHIAYTKKGSEPCDPA
jgi:hypothetical protein